MKKHIFIYMVLLVSFIFLITGCSLTGKASVKQSAAARQNVGENQVAIMNVDLSGGYSVEFASGAAYFYKGDSIDKSDVIAHAFVIDKSEYEEEISYFKNNSDLEGKFKDLKDGTYSYVTKDNAEYFFPSNDDFYLKVVVEEKFLDEADSIYTRFSAKSSEN